MVWLLRTALEFCLSFTLALNNYSWLWMSGLKTSTILNNWLFLQKEYFVCFASSIVPTSSRNVPQMTNLLSLTFPLYSAYTKRGCCHAGLQSVHKLLGSDKSQTQNYLFWTDAMATKEVMSLKINPIFTQ